MVGKQLRDLALDWGFKQDKQIWGEKHGYMLALEDGQGSKMITVSFATLNDEQRGALERFMTENKKELFVVNYGITSKMLTAQIKDGAVSGKVGIERILTFWQALLPILKEKDVHGADHCNVCDEPILEDYDAHTVRIGSAVVRAHRPCMESTQRDLDSSKEAFDNEKKNYIAGFFGALVGGLVASIPWILVQHFTGFLASALGLLIGAGAYKGYKLFGGRDGKGTLWIITILVIFSVAFTQIASLGIIMYENQIPIVYENFVILLNEGEIFRALLGDFAIGLLMAGLGVSGIVRRLHRAGKGSAPTLEILE